MEEQQKRIQHEIKYKYKYNIEMGQSGVDWGGVVWWSGETVGKIQAARKQIPEANTMMGPTWLIDGEKYRNKTSENWKSESDTIVESGMCPFIFLIAKRKKRNINLTFSPWGCLGNQFSISNFSSWFLFKQKDLNTLNEANSHVLTL